MPATVKLFELLLSMDPEMAGTKQKPVTRELNRPLTENFPRKTGVYYFYDKEGESIYVGKSVNICERVLSHLNNHSPLYSYGSAHKGKEHLTQLCEKFGLCHKLARKFN